MRIAVASLFLALAMLAFADDGASVIKPLPVTLPLDSPSAASDLLRQITPVQFLESLKATAKADVFQYSLEKQVKNWVSKQDVPALLALVDSDEPCSSVALTCSNYYYNRTSTVGREAVFMLEGYRKGVYPPTSYSGYFDPKYERSEREANRELIDWCRAQIGETSQSAILRQ